MQELAAETGVLANFRRVLGDDKLPIKVQEILRRDPRFAPTWDFKYDCPANINV